MISAKKKNPQTCLKISNLIWTLELLLITELQNSCRQTNIDGLEAENQNLRIDKEKMVDVLKNVRGKLKQADRIMEAKVSEKQKEIDDMIEEAEKERQQRQMVHFTYRLAAHTKTQLSVI